jgi:putative transposase
VADRRHHQQSSALEKGKLERWFRTVRLQLLPTLLEPDTRSLDALNQRLWTWIEDEYLDTPHRGLQDATPREQWARAAHHVTLPTQDLTTLFLFEEKRKVQQDRTVSLHSVVFEVDAALVGETVTLRYDPAHLTRGVTVVVQGRAVGTATRVDAYANCFVRRDHGTKLLTPSTASVPAPGLPLRKLDEDF